MAHPVKFDSNDSKVSRKFSSTDLVELVHVVSGAVDLQAGHRQPLGDQEALPRHHVERSPVQQNLPQVSGLRCQVPGLRCQVPGLRCQGQVSGLKFSGLRSHLSQDSPVCSLGSGVIFWPVDRRLGYLRKNLGESFLVSMNY